MLWHSDIFLFIFEMFFAVFLNHSFTRQVNYKYFSIKGTIFMENSVSVREAAKKDLLFNSRAIKALPPPPLRA